MSQDFEPLLKKANEAHREGRIGEALAYGERAIALQPENSSVNLLMALLEAKAGRFTSAIARFKIIAEANPTSFDALFWLSALYRNEGDLEQSLEYGRLAARVRPDESHVHSNLGLTQLANHDFLEAAASFERAIRLDPNIVRNYEHLGKILQLQSRDADALAAFQQAHRLAPDSLETLMALGQIAFSQNRTDEALKLGRQTLTRDPKSMKARLLIAGALIEQGSAAAAEEHLQAVLASEGKNGEAYALLGLRMQALGRMSEADDMFRRSIELQPNQGLAYCAMVRNSKMTEDRRPMLGQMEQVVQAANLNARGLSFLHFGLGKAYDDLKQYQLALEHFDRANEISYRLKFGNEVFDQTRLSSYVDWVIKTFTKEFLQKQERKANRSNCPIFILGMMRSGTTLTEQIVSSHPKVEGAGERAFWLTHGHDAIQPGTSFMKGDRLERLSERYLQELRSLFPNSPHITDKMPGNYRILGVIASALPNAKIIHTKRNPIDTCLSIYMIPNRVPNDFANNRENIVFAYRQYERLMSHWEQVLEPDRLLTVEYEQLVANPEPIVRSMIEFCGLSWDYKCLRPEENDRSVVTPSVWQVRQPIYTSSVERWRRYEPWLGAFGKLRT